MFISPSPFIVILLHRRDYISFVVLSYILLAKPVYLKADRDGVPYYTPQVIHPETGDSVSLGELIRHFKGE